MKPYSESISKFQNTGGEKIMTLAFFQYQQECFPCDDLVQTQQRIFELSVLLLVFFKT
jgi:hypothetical protein